MNESQRGEPMKKKYKIAIFTTTALTIAVLTFSFFYFSPLHFFPFLQKPEPLPQTNPLYEHYLIFDEADGRMLMEVPITVYVGDELLTEENQIYKVVRVEENRAYARFVEKVNLEKYKEQLK